VLPKPKTGIDDYLANGRNLEEIAALAVPLESVNLSMTAKQWRASTVVQELGKLGWRFARGGGQLYFYSDGVYRLARTFLLKYLTRLLESDWTPGRADAVYRFCLDASQELWEKPPLRIINVKNGLLDLDSAELRPHDPTFLSAVQRACHFNPDSECPAIERFVKEVFPLDALRLAYELAGWLAVPDTGWQKAVMLVGTGHNGKGTYLRLLTALLGAENVSTLTMQSISDNRFSTADLYGKLANICGDIPQKPLEIQIPSSRSLGKIALRLSASTATPLLLLPSLALCSLRTSRLQALTEPMPISVAGKSFPSRVNSPIKRQTRGWTLSCTRQRNYPAC